MKKSIKGNAGFTLIEISMVLLLFATAIGGLLSFFPVGLRQERSAIADSAQTMFALNVLGQIEANAAILTWEEWDSDKNFIKDIKVGGESLKLNDDTKVDNYLINRKSIKYRLEIFKVKAPYNDFKGRIKRAVIWVTDNRDGKPKDNAPFSVDLFYMGTPPQELGL